MLHYFVLIVKLHFNHDIQFLSIYTFIQSVDVESESSSNSNPNSNSSSNFRKLLLFKKKNNNKPSCNY